MKKKVIIVEGPDNCGKDLLISKLKLDFENPLILHAGIPPKDGSLFGYYYNGIIHDTLKSYYDNDHDAIIHNRSMYGEFVYGQKYRGGIPSDIAEMIYKLETGRFRTFISQDDIYFILLTSSSVDLLVNNDDGSSISNKAVDIQDEIVSFDTIFNLSHIKNKKRIYVNNGDAFRDSDDIYNEVISFIAK